MYALLGLTLLPQTFLVLAILELASFFGLSTASGAAIIFSVALAVAPLGCWALWLFIGEELPKRWVDLAADRAPFALIGRILIGTFASRLCLLFLMLLAIALGNFLIPFALGDNTTYTGLVYLLSFSSNLGRDWATIAAAGVLLLTPTVATATVFGLWVSRSVRPTI
jgi:hypothetical protein